MGWRKRSPPWLDRLKAPQKREDYRDRSTRGLQLRVSSTGVKSVGQTEQNLGA